MSKSNFLNKDIWLKYNLNDISGDLDLVSTFESNKEDNSYSTMRISFLIIWIKLATLNQQVQHPGVAKCKTAVTNSSPAPAKNNPIMAGPTRGAMAVLQREAALGAGSPPF